MKDQFLEQDVENVDLNQDGLQGPPEIDNILPGLPHESTSPIKIICKFCYISTKDSYGCHFPPFYASL